MTDRLPQTKAWLLLGLMFLGSLLLALGVPYAALWGVAQLGRDKLESFYLGMLGCPLAVLAWAAVVGRLNVAYREASGRRDDDMLGMCLAIAVMAALAVLIATMIVFGGPDPQSGGPWSY